MRSQLKKLRSEIEEFTDKVLSINVDSVEGAVFGVVNKKGDLGKRYQRVGSELRIVDDGPDLQIPEKLSLLLKPRMTKVVYGGRGSAKTRSIVSIIIDAVRMQTHRVLCCREIQKSISESSKQELEDEIARRGLSNEFKITDNRISHYRTGSYIVFEGLLRNETKIKGFANITICWVEEAENVSQKSWDALEPTIRAENAETWISFNPRTEEDPTYVSYVLPYVKKLKNGVYDSIEDDIIVININYDENPWFTKTLRKKMEKMKRTDYERYLWIWEGKFWDRKESQILSGKWRVGDFDIPANVVYYYGADWGFSNDPTTLIKMFVHENKLYICEEMFQVGLGLDETRDKFLTVEGAHSHMIFADCARPETISHLQKQWNDKDGVRKKGYKIKGAKKWPGSVEDGITYLRSFEEIVIHPSCTNIAYEAAHYCYKVDKTTDIVLPDIVDKDNHGWDAVRYALSKQIQDSKRRKVPLAW